MANRRIAVTPGDKYGKLTVIRETESIQYGKYKIRMVQCICECRQETVTRLEYLRSGHTKSCGCNVNTIFAKTQITHGKSKTRIHGIWASMHSRCRNKRSKSYVNYGARGITVCEEWLQFQHFYKWAMSNGYRNDLTIERINNNEGYCPENCTWIPRSEQSKNRRCCNYITYNRVTLSVSEWADKTGMNVGTLDSRLRSGWSIKRALTQPVRGSKQQHD